jgi:hypothetical protein
MIECLPKDIPANKILAQHYFVGNEAGGLSPVWDFRATPKFEGVENATFVGKALANISDADPTKNVPWLHLGKVGGEIADEVYRIFTVGGVAPSSVSFWCITGAVAFDRVDGCVDMLLSLSIPSVRWRDDRGHLRQVHLSILVPWRFLGIGLQVI